MSTSSAVAPYGLIALPGMINHWQNPYLPTFDLCSARCGFDVKNSRSLRSETNSSGTDLQSAKSLLDSSEKPKAPDKRPRHGVYPTHRGFHELRLTEKLLRWVGRKMPTNLFFLPPRPGTNIHFP